MPNRAAPRSLRLWLPALLLGLVWPALLLADEPSAVVVMDVRPSGPVSENQVAGLSAILTSEVASHRQLRVISNADVREMLGFEAQRQLLGCDDTTCLAEIGGALGAAFLLTSEVSHFGESWLFTLVLLDLQAIKPVGRLTVRTTSEEALLDEMGPAVRRVFESLLGDEQPPVSSAPPKSRDARPRSGGLGRTLGWTTLGSGLAVVAGGSVLYGQSYQHYSRMTAEFTTPIYTHAEVELYQRRADLGVGMLIGGGALTAGGIVLLALFARGGAGGPAAGESLSETVFVAPVAMPGFAGVTVEVRGW